MTEEPKPSPYASVKHYDVPVTAFIRVSITDDGKDRVKLMLKDQKGREYTLMYADTLNMVDEYLIIESQFDEPIVPEQPKR